MDLSSCLLLSLLFILIAENAFSICIPPNHCIEEMADSDAQERFDYVLGKYEELDMKVTGKPVGLHGKVVTHGEAEEQHLVFQYVDNTLHDIIQTCAFVVATAPGECEGIRTYCSGFLGRTPRPLLERQPIAVCEDGVRVAEEEPETQTETKTVQVPGEDPSANGPADADPQKAPNEAPSESEKPSSKFRKLDFLES